MSGGWGAAIAAPDGMGQRDILLAAAATRAAPVDNPQRHTRPPPLLPLLPVPLSSRGPLRVVVRILVSSYSRSFATHKHIHNYTHKNTHERTTLNYTNKFTHTLKHTKLIHSYTQNALNLSIHTHTHSQIYT